MQLVLLAALVVQGASWSPLHSSPAGWRARCVRMHDAETECVVHVHGLPWELSGPEAAAVLQPLLPSRYTLVDAILPLDKRARNTGRALLRLRARAAASDSSEDSSEAAVVAVSAMQGQLIGTRWLDVRPSDSAEYSFQARQIASIRSRVEGQTPQAFCRPTQADKVRLPTDPRDIVLLCHATPPLVAAGDIDLNNLPAGRVDVLARCVAAALCVSHGVRKHTRVWLMLRDANVSVVCDG